MVVAFCFVIFALEDNTYNAIWIFENDVVGIFQLIYWTLERLNVLKSCLESSVGVRKHMNDFTQYLRFMVRRRLVTKQPQV